MFENRRWLVIPTSKINDIDFNQVHQSSAGNLRTSVDGLETFVKYDVVEVLEAYDTTFTNPETEEEVTTTTAAGVYGRPSIYTEDHLEYNHTDILALLDTEAWTTPEESV